MPAVALLACAVVTYQAVRLWLADHRIHSETLESIESGVRLEPGNADAWDELGRFRQLDFTSGDAEASLAAYKRAVAAEPASAALPMNLASAYESAGDVRAAREQYAAARAEYPLSAEVSWNY